MYWIYTLIADYYQNESTVIRRILLISLSNNPNRKDGTNSISIPHAVIHDKKYSSALKVRQIFVLVHSDPLLIYVFYIASLFVNIFSCTDKMSI